MLEALIPNWDEELSWLRTQAPAGFILAFNITYRGPEYLHSEYPQAWQAIYDQRNFFAVDPVFRWIVFVNDGRARWSEIELPDPIGVLPQAVEHGLSHGMAVSRKIGEKRSFLTAARADRPFADDELTAIGERFDAMANLVTGSANLSAAEIEALRYIRDGYEQNEIAAALGVSHSAVKQRLQRAMSKLGARNSAQAAAICVARHYFDR